MCQIHSLLYRLPWKIWYSLVPPGNDYQVSFDWDDSIVVDAEADMEKDFKMLSAGIIRPEEFRSKWLGETLEEAQKNLPEPANVEE